MRTFARRAVVVLLTLSAVGGLEMVWAAAEQDPVPERKMGEDEKLPGDHLSAPREGEGAKPLVNVVVDRQEEYKDFPYPDGWPLMLPGQASGTPVVADFWGDGKLVVVATCQPARRGTPAILHPEPSEKALVYALDGGGKVIPNWPVPFDNSDVTWASSPSVFKHKGNDYLVVDVPKDFAVVMTPLGRWKAMKGFAHHINNVPLADVAGNGGLDLIVSRTASTVEGDPIPGWNASFENGFAPCIGDACLDGKMKVYHLFYTTRNTDVADLVGFDREGTQLEGWPRVIDDASWHAPVMGDIAGDEKFEVVAAYGQHLFAWSWDGKPVEGAGEDGSLNGILKSGISGSQASPSLADLDGDGKAEIILYDQRTQSVCAWHGNGKPFGKEDDGGVIAKIPDRCSGGVSVVGLGEPGAWDFFVGTYWVRRKADGTTTVTKMIPGNGDLPRWTQPTVADLYGDGKAEVIFGLGDGRLFVYKTGLKIRDLQWPTAQGNFQHTGCWVRPPLKK